MPQNEALEKLFENLTENLNIDPTKHMIFNQLTPDQEKIYNNAMEILKNNLNGDPKKFGGKLNEEEFKKVEEEVLKRLDNDIFKEHKKDLEKLAKRWLELKRNELNSYIFAIFPVKEMPFPSASFITVPRIVWPKGKLDKMSLDTNGIAYAGEIKALITRTTLFGKPSKNKPLFAPHIGPLDMAAYKLTPEEKGPKNENMRFVYEVINSLERRSTQNQVMRYDDQYERHGEPICDFLIKDEDLVKTLSKLTSAIDSKRQSSGSAIPAIALIVQDTTLVLTTDESNSSKKFEICFEALLKFAAACYETPGVKKAGAIQAEAEAMTQVAQSVTPPSMGIGAMVPTNVGSTPVGIAPGIPQLPVWTEEELAEEAKKSGLPPVDLPVWTEEELEEEAKKRTDINLPMWTEEELEKEKERRHGAFNIPEWKPDENTIDCPKCGYTCRPEWKLCPICNTQIPELSQQQNQQPTLQDEEPKQETKEKTSNKSNNQIEEKNNSENNE